MNKSLLAFAACAALSLSWSADTMAQTAVEHGGRTFYGFFLSNENFNNAAYPSYGFSKQTFAFPGDNELIFPFDGITGLYAATCAEGIYYACPYSFSSSMQEPAAMPVMKYNITNGLVEDLGKWNQEDNHFKPSDMTYDILNKKIYAICFNDTEGTSIYEMNMDNGAFTRVCPARGGVIAADATGRIFTIDHDGWLYQINLSNGKATPIFDTKCTSMMSNQSLEFDHTTGELYWASITMTDSYNDEGVDTGDRGRMTHLRAIKVPTLPAGQNYTSSVKGFDMTDFGEIGTNARFQGLYIPYAEGGFDAPGAVEEFSAVSNSTGTGSNLSFKLPVKTFGGDELTSINGYAIYRDGVEVSYASSVTPGQAVTWSEDGIGEAGMYRYDVIVFNAAGDGPKTPAFSYIGNDRPAAVKDIAVNISQDFTTVDLTWTAPTEGFHLGTFDPASVTYDVVRLPDNFKVAENITDTKATDTFFRRMLRYSYQVIAKNAQGETVATSSEFIAGPAKTVPVSEDFIDENSFRNNWMDYDNNNDGMSWLFGTTLGHAIFGDYEQCAEYIVSMTSIDSNTKDADEWLISPPIKFEEGKKYAVKFKARAFDPEKFNVYFGPRNVVEGMQQVASYDVVPVGIDPATGTTGFATFVTELPDEICGTISCVGFQLATPLGEQPTHYFQVSTIDIVENNSGIDNIGADTEEPVRVEGRDIIAPAGSAVYDLAGRPAGTTDLPAGVYIVTTPARNNVKVVVK